MKLFTKKNLLLIAAIFAIVGFIGAFLSPLKMEYMGMTENGKIGDVYFGETGVILPFLAFFLLIAGAVVLFLASKKDSKKLAIIGIALLVVGALVPLFTEALYINANMADIPAEYAAIAKAAAKEMYSLGFGPILGAIGGFGGAAIAAAATFVVKK
jgi:hypothetical protein